MNDTGDPNTFMWTDYHEYTGIFFWKKNNQYFFLKFCSFEYEWKFSVFESVFTSMAVLVVVRAKPKKRKLRRVNESKKSGNRNESTQTKKKTTVATKQSSTEDKINSSLTPTLNCGYPKCILKQLT